MSRFKLNLLLMMFSVVAVGCEKKDTVINFPTEPGETVTILTDGRVLGGDGVIKCEDDSSTIPSGRIAHIRWTIRAPSGDTVGSANTLARGEETFSGFTPGEYSVEQTVILDDGAMGPPKSYGVIVE